MLWKFSQQCLNGEIARRRGTEGEKNPERGLTTKRGFQSNGVEESNKINTSSHSIQPNSRTGIPERDPGLLFSASIQARRGQDR
jgi:hypothetical protein